MPQTQTPIGALNRRVTVVQRSSTRDSAGGVSDTWTDKATVWAAIDIQYSSLIYETSEFVSKATYRIVLRWSNTLGLKVSDRIRYVDPTTRTTHMYEVQSITNPAMANRELLLLAYELNGDQ
jgi:SPP1 family predicted phage head-tail adaptor